jgi:hypothetical protein
LYFKFEMDQRVSILSSMPTDLYFVLKYISFASTTHIAYIDACYNDNVFGPFHGVITEFDCIFI